MPLLVSVRSAEEVPAALAGGADIIDAKEPSRGPLGAVDPEVLWAIAARTPANVPLGVALGDAAARRQVEAVVSAARVPARGAPVYLKLGFAGVAPQRVPALLDAAVAAAAEGAERARVVAVAYADHGAAASAAPEEMLRMAKAAGAVGLLVDTWRKAGAGLLDYMPLERLSPLSAAARAAGLLFAVAGSLDRETVPLVVGIADVIGVRGAACRGGRTGRVDAGRVRQLRALIGEPAALSSAG
jgi:uncharacterized protein (UPF0264 family)